MTSLEKLLKFREKPDKSFNLATTKGELELVKQGELDMTLAEAISLLVRTIELQQKEINKLNIKVRTLCIKTRTSV